MLKMVISLCFTFITDKSVIQSYKKWPNIYIKYYTYSNIFSNNFNRNIFSIPTNSQRGSSKINLRLKGDKRNSENPNKPKQSPPFVINFNFLWKIPKEIISIPESVPKSTTYELITILHLFINSLSFHYFAYQSGNSTCPRYAKGSCTSTEVASMQLHRISARFREPRLG